MPVARYFIFVGGALAVLLFIPGWLLPKPPAMFADQSVALNRAVIRIKSAEKWIVECANDLKLNRGQCLVVAGHRQPLEVHEQPPPQLQQMQQEMQDKTNHSLIRKHGLREVLSTLVLPTYGVYTNGLQ